MRVITPLAGYAARAYRAIAAALPNPAFRDEQLLLRYLGSHGIPRALRFQSGEFKRQVLGFVERMRAGDHEYRYAPSVKTPTLYSSAYACLTMSLFGALDKLSEADRRAWAAYFDRFQSPDGLFRDPAVSNEHFEDGDSWGARHLVLHMIAVYTALGTVPRYRFAYLRPYMSPDCIAAGQFWNRDILRSGDVDNRIMNLVCVLQYERDARGDDEAREAVETWKQFLLEKRDPRTRCWGRVDANDPAALSRAAQFAYHLYAIFFYDRWNVEGAEGLIDLILRTQNELGGFSPKPNASACEDIDSLDFLCRLSLVTQHRADEVRLAIERARVWMLANQNEDGGFVFRRNEPFSYGHPNMKSGRNESAMFPTWFRSLAIALAQSWSGDDSYRFLPCPGLQFGLMDGAGERR